ncbi:unnamed protein product [Rotaria sordida]|uniref:Uncharacterized protein n=1 Tax=Rotaria sordida TaxID=392033 RepID=A0A819NRJ0_9BILA|nr:unnamed protein product [Rotaria sordida]CAF4003650.1 unnamed protein product [Rotaria sordida]
MDAFLSQPISHSHAPQPDRVPAIQLKNDIKARASTTDESSSSIFHSTLRTYPLSAVGELPRNEALMSMIRRQRTVETVDADGRLPEKLRKTKTNIGSLMERFKMCPDDYYQLFTLHAMMTNAIIPLVYGLLIGKSTEDYNLFFEKVLEQDDFQSESIMTDFETGTINSVKEMLPNVLYIGMF